MAVSKTENAMQSLFKQLLVERDAARAKHENERAKLLNDTVNLICDTRDKYRLAVSTHK